jgi:hypothetical protein
MIRLLGYTWFDWMHPSWRDMVIEFLVERKEARENFLRKCGVHGLLLALSTGGGKHGLRKFPLLIEPSDWSVFTESVSNVITAGTASEMRSLLKAILDALRAESSTNNQPIVARPPLRDVADHALAACRTKWSADGWTIESTDLASYYQISEFLSPLPASPGLAQTWQRHWDEARAQMEGFDEYQGDLVTYDIDEWFDLCAVLLRYEPRFLHQVRFPAQYVQSVKDFLPDLRERAEWAPDFESIDDCDTELETQETIYDLAEKVGRVFRDLADVTAGVTAAAENTQEQVSDRKTNLEEQAGDDPPEYLRDDADELEDEDDATTGSAEKKPNAVFLTVPPTAELPIDQLFDDL